MRYDFIPDEIKQLPQWVCVWNNSKIPMQASIKKGASSVNPDTWSDFETARQAVEEGIYDNLGFVFNNNGIVGIDIDCGFDEDGFLSQISTDIIRHTLSYTEVSRSGLGVHILLKGDLPFKGKNNGQGVEIYKASRYFIVTGNKLLYADMIDNQAAIDYVVETYFPEVQKESSPTNRTDRIYSPIYQRPKDGKISLRPIYPKIPCGMRNLSLTSLAGQLHSQGYTKLEIYREVLYANSVACSPPLKQSEIQTIINSITKYER